jgi:cell fate regulator YaaT (PSP1 superfamily)
MFYFYFYAEMRFQFSDFVKRFREQTKANFFLFQIGARDMIKLSPATDNLIGCNGLHLCCKSSRPLPSVEIESVILQNLEGRDIEKLKGRCGKLKCSLIYEVDTYLKESAKFPRRGEKIEDSCGKCGFCTSFNVMTQEITARTQEGELFRFKLAELKKAYKEISNSSLPKQTNEVVAHSQD